MTQGTKSREFCAILDHTADREGVSSEAPLGPRIRLLGADYLNSNLGIRALTNGAVTAIHAQFPNADIKIIEYGRKTDEFTFELHGKSVPVPMLNMRFSKQIWVRNHIARLIATAWLLKVFPHGLRSRIIERDRLLNELNQADYVFALSGGDSFSDIYGLKRLVYMSLPQVLALLLGKKVIQLPQTIGPFKHRISRWLARWILSRSALIYSRDAEAVPQVRTLVPEKQADRVRFCPDLGFVVPSKARASEEPELRSIFSRRPVIGLNVSGLLYMGGYSRKNMFSLASDYKVLVHRIIKHFIEVKGTCVVLVPHLLWPRGEGDILAAEDIAEELKQAYPGRLLVLRTPYDESEVKSFIGRCDFFVGARMHACIAALSQCVPTVAMAYSWKFLGVFRSVGVERAVVDLRRLSIEEVVSCLDKLFDSRISIASSLKARVPQVQRSILSLMKQIPSAGNPVNLGPLANGIHDPEAA